MESHPVIRIRLPGRHLHAVDHIVRHQVEPQVARLASRKGGAERKVLIGDLVDLAHLKHRAVDEEERQPRLCAREFQEVAERDVKVRSD